MNDLADIMRQLESLPPEDRARLEAEVMAATGALRFIPNPGKQTMAMLSPADVILFGGSAGGGGGVPDLRRAGSSSGWRRYNLRHARNGDGRGQL